MKKRNNGRKRATKLEKNAQRKGDYTCVEIVGSAHHQTCGDERKDKKKEYLSGSRKLLQTKHKSHQRDGKLSKNKTKQKNDPSTWILSGN